MGRHEGGADVIGDRTVALLVEDNAVNAELTQTLLRNAGYEVHDASTAAQALRLAQELRPALILMDLRLPDGSGLEVVQVLRSQPGFDATAIIAVTASAMRGDEELAVAAGCDGYLPKPIDTRSFAARVAEMMAVRRGGAT